MNQLVRTIEDLFREVGLLVGAAILNAAVALASYWLYFTAKASIVLGSPAILAFGVAVLAVALAVPYGLNRFGRRFRSKKS